MSESKQDKGRVRETRWATLLRKRVGQAAQRMPVAQVMRKYGVPKRFVTYWREKTAQPAAFHPSALGGARRFLLSDRAQGAAEALLHRLLVVNYIQNKTEIATAMRGFGVFVDRR